MSHFAGRLGIMQRVLPSYRAPFFDLLAQHTDGLSVFAGQPGPDEAIRSAMHLDVAHWQTAMNLHIFSGPLYLCYQRGALDWLQRTEPDALIVEANPRYLSTPQAIRWMRAHGRPVLGWGLGAPPVRGPLANIRNTRRRKFLQQFDGIIAYSQHGATQYRTLDIPAERIFVAPNAVAPRPTAPPAPRPTSGPVTVLYVGRLQARKRLDVLLRACAKLPSALQPKLVLVGDGPARQQLEQLANQLYPNTEFTGHLHGEALAKQFARAELFVMPGTGGLAVQQAMAHGLAIIVGEGDGSQADLVDAENGWLLPPGDDDALSSALAHALQDRAALQRMGAASYQRVQDSHNLENMAAAFIDAINTVSR
ncbi:MAG TPA: glycosyltransferase [Anaerolineales bacterium]|nr:glycosyltransferase [Anaerolineales bacterium]HRQ93320.1 glycosyltransferase [Anaerolineales bacterium]